MRSLTGMLCLIISLSGWALERDYQERYCEGVQEYHLPSGARVDCLTDTHAIEFEYARKYDEAIGQALYYAMETGKRGGVVLILSDGDRRFLDRLRRMVEHYSLPVDVWAVSKTGGWE